MANRINTALLIENLLTAEEHQSSLEANSYLAMNLLMPMKNDQWVSIGDIDFSAFEEDEIDDFMESLEELDKEIIKFNGFERAFKRAAPKAIVKPSFC